MTQPRSTNTGRDKLDGELLRRVAKRDPGALEVFFEHFFPRAYRYVTRLLGDPVAAQDVVQEGFLRLHAAVERLDPERDPAPWVFAIVTNTARDYWRSRAYRTSKRTGNLDDAWDIATSESSNPERALEKQQTAAAVERALAQLSAADREIILLREYEGMTAAELEATLGCSAVAARQRWSRAVRRLGQAYAREVARDELRSR